MVLVGGEFVDVVGGDDGRLLAGDESPELSVRDDIAVGVLAIERDHGVGGRVAANVSTLNIDAEHHRIQRADATAHGSGTVSIGIKPRRNRNIPIGS